jgi:hypothetical protein
LRLSQQPPGQRASIEKLDGPTTGDYSGNQSTPEVLMNAYPQPILPQGADRRRLKTETSASNGWAAQLLALQSLRELKRPERSEPEPS